MSDNALVQELSGLRTRMEELEDDLNETSVRIHQLEDELTRYERRARRFIKG